jgi:hypothetical protein
MEWSFHYIGPKDPIDDADCPLCTTVRRGVCREHGARPLVGCAHCDAVRDKVCASHCGIESALERHVPEANDPQFYRLRAGGNVEVTVVSDKGAMTAGGMIQHRVDRPSTPELEAKRAHVRAHFDVVKAAVVAHAKLLPEGSIEVHARGDDTAERHSFELTIGHFG